MSAQNGQNAPIRGACMECRRLKTKCDRGVPCNQCIKRGCEAICPSGLRPRGSKHSSVEVDSLQRNITNMSSRIRQLEQALELARAKQISSAAHQRSNSSSPHSSYSSHLGHLDPPSSDSLLNSPGLATRGYFEHDALAARRQQILSQLPSESQAWELVDTFYSSIGTVFTPVTKPRLVNVILKNIYTTPSIASNSEISILLAIFALAANQSANTNSAPARYYYDLSLSALHLDDTFEQTTVETIEAMTLQSRWLYDNQDPQHHGRRAWTYTGLTMRLAEAIGLHRDPKHLAGLDDEECRRRRRLFWELLWIDAGAGLWHKRPPALHETYIDVEMPYDTYETFGADPSYIRWKHNFLREAILPMAQEVACCAKTPIYSTVIKADKRIRACTFPTALQFVNLKEAPLETLLQTQEMFMVRELCLVRLHRDYFFQAIEQSPEDPTQNYAGHSVTTLIDCCVAVYRRLRCLIVNCPNLIPRLSWACDGILVALTDMAMFIKKCPNAPQVSPVYMAFEMGCKILADAANENPRISHYVPILVDARREVHNKVPHLQEALQKALEERKASMSPVAVTSANSLVDNNGSSIPAHLTATSALVPGSATTFNSMQTAPTNGTTSVSAEELGVAGVSMIYPTPPNSDMFTIPSIGFEAFNAHQTYTNGMNANLLPETTSFSDVMHRLNNDNTMFSSHGTTQPTTVDLFHPQQYSQINTQHSTPFHSPSHVSQQIIHLQSQQHTPPQQHSTQQYFRLSGDFSSSTGTTVATSMNGWFDYGSQAPQTPAHAFV